ncbi:type VII toxin-antitoxin system MntA family adenylyltransferase antitoxin [Aliagarivorans taiwanensis]|uniref:type VII toxin-antitoxin system MntA family adenylyltransferase antitoxin n=1 Tax=Aliagarivorans taiwanensis TaxID=561966 RepID=UPI00040E27D2|nr:nucleotidyltransferase domain-containing protein [Aliagarivorans taiwanensis]
MACQEQIENNTERLTALSRLAEANQDVAVLWLYGSRAKGNYSDSSDWDLAVAFEPPSLADPLERRLRPELLAMDWQRALGLPEGKLSIIDINSAPVPLAFAAIDACTVVFSADEARRLREEQRIMSKMEHDVLTNQKTEKYS